MVRFFLPFLLFCFAKVQTRAQKPAAVGAIPSPEEFVNAVFPAIVNGQLDHYYLVSGTDSCRFLKYNYDEWVKYHLTEPVPFAILNDLAQKVYLSRYPYYWKTNRLKKAVCVTRHQADSILEAKKDFVFSFSLPQFTDDGQFGLIDLNLSCGPECGKGLTCIFHRTATGDWKLVGEDTNWDTR